MFSTDFESPFVILNLFRSNFDVEFDLWLIPSSFPILMLLTEALNVFNVDFSFSGALLRIFKKEGFSLRTLC
jgi:hypothetical protein